MHKGVGGRSLGARRRARRRDDLCFHVFLRKIRYPALVGTQVSLLFGESLLVREYVLLCTLSSHSLARICCSSS